MANLPEQPVYEEGIYQLETTDPVQGGPDGVSNLPLKQLANRTAYLKETVDAIGDAIGDFAPINSPEFTGTPKAPTPQLGNSSTAIATTAFVQAAARGVLTKSVAGGSNVTLSAAEAGNAILILTGLLEDDIDIILPNTGRWLIVNATSGEYGLTVRTAAGSGVTVAQGKSRDVYGDGTDIKYVDTDTTGFEPDLSNYYTKTEIDSQFDGYYTKTETNSLIDGVAGDVDAALEDYYDKTEIDSALAGKVSKSGDTMSGKLGVVSVDAQVEALGNVSGSKSIDVSAASTFTMTITGNTTFSFTNPPGAGRDQVVYLKITNGGAYTITWPQDTMFAGGEAPTLTEDGTDLLALWYDEEEEAWVVGVVFADYQATE